MNRSAVLPKDSTVVRGVVPRNATLDAILRAHGLAGDAVAEVASVTRLAAARRPRPGQRDAARRSAGHPPHARARRRGPAGAEVVAVASGTAVSATDDATGGWMIRLRHPSGDETYYLYLSAFGPAVRAGARRMPPGEPVPPHAMAAFEAERDQALARLADAALQAPPGAVAASD